MMQRTRRHHDKVKRRPDSVALAADARQDSRMLQQFNVLAIVLLLALLGLMLPTTAQSSENTCVVEEGAIIRVTVNNVRASKGLITASLYNEDPDGFLDKDARLEKERVDAKEGETLICLVAPGPGVYAVALYHDENGNRKFDKNFIGIPKEAFGFSNNPKIGLAPPDHKDVSFTVEGPVHDIQVSLDYR